MPGLKGDYGNADRNPIRRRFRPSDVVLRGRGPQDAFDKYQLTGDGALLVGNGLSSPSGVLGPSELLTVGECVPSRFGLTTTATISSGFLYTSFFTCQRTEPVTSLVFCTAGTVQTGATLVRYGLWTADASGALLNRVAETANNTALLATTANVRHPEPILIPYTKIRGQRYAVGVLVVTAGTAPNSPTGQMGPTAVNLPISVISPRLSSYVGGQADLPTSVAAQAVGNAGIYLYAEVI